MILCFVYMYFMNHDCGYEICIGVFSVSFWRDFFSKKTPNLFRRLWYRLCTIIITRHPVFSFFFFSSQIAMFWEHIKVLSFCMLNCFIITIFGLLLASHNSNGNFLVIVELIFPRVTFP